MGLIISVDFDGVIHSYTSGWRGAAVIPDPPVPGAINGLLALLEAEFDVQIYSARSSQEGGIEAMKTWLIEEYRKMPPAWRLSNPTPQAFIDKIEFPTSKPPAFLTIDDRAICFDGDWAGILPKVTNFKPWYK